MSRSIRLIDVAPTMARVLGVKTPHIDGVSIDEVEGWGCDKVVLAIVDSLGYGLYKALEEDLPTMRSMSKEGLLLKAECVAPSTTPAIASILTGLLPHNHGISNTSQASESEIRSLLEWASTEKVRSAVVMEAEGARTFDGFVSMAMGVPKSLDVRVSTGRSWPSPSHLLRQNQGSSSPTSSESIGSRISAAETMRSEMSHLP